MVPRKIVTALPQRIGNHLGNDIAALVEAVADVGTRQILGEERAIRPHIGIIPSRAGYKLKDNVVMALTAEQFNASSLMTTAAIATERRIIASFTTHF
jgi:hypothetical protein